jgi:hypothetical protein
VTNVVLQAAAPVDPNRLRFSDPYYGSDDWSAPHELIEKFRARCRALDTILAEQDVSRCSGLSRNARKTKSQGLLGEAGGAIHERNRLSLRTPRRRAHDGRPETAGPSICSDSRSRTAWGSNVGEWPPSATAHWILALGPTAVRSPDDCCDVSESSWATPQRRGGRCA